MAVKLGDEMNTTVKNYDYGITPNDLTIVRAKYQMTPKGDGIPNSKIGGRVSVSPPSSIHIYHNKLKIKILKI